MRSISGGRAWPWFVVSVVALAACGAAEEPVDPADLELRDLLGVAPRVAVAWDGEQREAARHVLAAGLGEREPEALALPATRIDEAQVIGALADADGRLLDRDRDALGLVVVEHLDVAADGRAIDAPVAGAALAGEAVASAIVLELDERAWPCPGTCSFDVVAGLAIDAAPGAARVRVVPVVQLAVVAALLPAGDDGVPTLLVNPIVTAVGEPAAVMAVAASSGGAASGAAGGGARSTPVRVAPSEQARLRVAPLVTATWVYEPRIADCASQVQVECVQCRNGGACQDIWPGVSGADACTMLDANPGENYTLLCINLAVSLGDVGACVARRNAGCMIDASAIADPADLRANVVFVNDTACRNALEACLVELFGADDSGGGCSCGSCDCGGCDCNDNQSDSCSLNDSNMDNNCDGCKNDDGSCNTCGDSSSGDGCGNCNDSGGGGGGGCNNGGGGGSCSVVKKPAARGTGLAAGIVWVLLPVPAALFARRRARRRGGAATPPSDVA